MERLDMHILQTHKHRKRERERVLRMECVTFADIEENARKHTALLK